MRFIKHIFNVLFFTLVALSSWAQTESEILKNANELFEKEAYVEATSLFLQLINLNPTDPDLNFKYGTCSLYNDDKQKKDAVKFLVAATQTPTVDPRAFYFRGKALHWNYQFDEAKKYYQIYKDKRATKDDRYDVDREIEMCKNGKKLMIEFTDIIVSEKTQIENDKFFRLYKDMQSIGGDILVTERFQSKLDKKKGHVPIVHFPKNGKAVYYSSYGETGTTGLDIYVRKKLPDNSWGDPYRLPGEINTEYDEDFPYMHPNGRYLYFSSKGHNSMGGFDVFLARMNPETNQFEQIENVDFAISSPDDDLFYVVDSAYQNAYFASARQSEKGKLHVYRVKVVRIPIQDVIVMGDFASEINPDNKNVSILVTSSATGSEIGKIVSNKVGKYSFVFPKGGSYILEISIDGLPPVKKTIELPFLDEFRPLKQKIVHKIENGNEIVKVINLFDEEVEGGEELVAQILRSKSSLEVNIDKFDVDALKAIELEARRDELLAELGFQGMSVREVQNQLNELANADVKRVEQVKKLDAGIANAIIGLSEEIKSVTSERDALLAQAATEADPSRKNDLLVQAQLKEAERTRLVDQANGLEDLKAEVERKFTSSNSENSEIAKVEVEFNRLIEAGKEEEALTYLAGQKAAIDQSKGTTTKGMVDKLVEETIDLKKRQDELSQRNQSNTREIEAAQTQKQALETKLPNAKKKDAERMTVEIAELDKTIQLYNDEKNFNSTDIVEIDKKITVIDTKVEVIQSSGTSVLKEIDKRKLEEALALLNAQESEAKDEEINAQIALLEKQNPNGFTPTTIPEVKDLTQKEILDEIAPNYQAEQKNIESDLSLSELDRQKELQANDEKLKLTAENRLKKVQAKLETNPDDISAIQELQHLNNILFDTNRAIEDREKRIESLENQTPDVAVTKQDVISDISPNYQVESKRIQSDQNLSEKEKLASKNKLDESLKSTVETRTKEVDDLLESTPDNPELLGEKELLAEILVDLKTAIDKRATQIEKLNASEVKPLTFAEAIAEIQPNYNTEKNAIETNSGLTEKEKLNQQQNLDVALVSDLKNELADVTKKLSNDPSNVELKARENGLQEAITTIQGEMDERTQTINALNSVSSVIDVEATKSAILTEIKADYDERLNTIDQSSKSEVDKNLDRLKLEQEIFAALEKREAEADVKAKNDPGNQQAQADVSALKELVAEQEKVIEEQRQASLIAAKSAKVYEETIAAADKKYSVEIGELMNETIPSGEKIAAREEAFQGRLETALAKKKSSLDRKYSVDMDLEAMILENEILESKKRAEQARKGSDVVSTPTQNQTEYVEDLRKEFLSTPNLAFNEATSTVDDARAYESKLNEYLSDLESNKEKIQSELEAEPENLELLNQLKWISEEEKAVQKEVQHMSVIIGDLESNPLAVRKSTETDPELIALERKSSELKSELSKSDLTSTERKELENELADVNTQTTIRKNSVQTEEIAVSQQKQDNLNNALQQLGGTNSDSPTVKAATESSEEERKAIEALLVKSEKAKSEEERNYLLTEAQNRQEVLNANLERVVENQEIQNIEKSEGITVLSREDLENRRRGFVIDIGELEVRQDQVDEQISVAKRKELPALNDEKSAIDAQLNLLTKQLEQIDARIANLDVEEPLDRIASLGLEQEISFSEERKIAASDNYKNYLEEGVKALEIENQMRILQSDLDAERQELVRSMSTPKSTERDEEIKLSTAKIKDLELELQQLDSDFKQQMSAADRLLPDDQDEAMKIKNLLVRGVQPIKTAVIATALIQMPSNGFAIDNTAESIYSESNPIPVGVKGPSGLTYRVQVGAFSRPIPQDLFKEFNPVSGEKIGTTGITRYMAGFFNNSETVINARESIRALGYSDAFVVAYCDGERITFGEARRLEASGECVPKGTNVMVLEIAENTAEHMGIPTVNELVELPELAYNQAPGAAKAAPIELKQGLFFTVQVGVYNRPVDDAQLKNLPEILTVRLPNGLIRYSSGMFDSAEEATPRRTEAQSKGISDAFIVAYYKGERITVARARVILEENGPSILQSNIERQRPVEVVKVPENAQRSDSVTTRVVETTNPTKQDNRKVQIVTKKTFDEYPRDVLNRYNTEGNFYFDETDKKVKSEIYSNKKELPRLYKFENDIDTVYLSESELQNEFEKQHVKVKLLSDKVPGDLADWLLRMGFQKKFVRTNVGLELHIEGIEPNQVQDVQYRIREVGLEPLVVEPELEEIEDK